MTAASRNGAPGGGVHEDHLCVGPGVREDQAGNPATATEVEGAAG